MLVIRVCCPLNNRAALHTLETVIGHGFASFSMKNVEHFDVESKKCVESHKHIENDDAIVH